MAFFHLLLPLAGHQSVVAIGCKAAVGRGDAEREGAALEGPALGGPAALFFCFLLDLPPPVMRPRWRATSFCERPHFLPLS